MKMRDALGSWLSGAEFPEYFHSGQRVDVLKVLYGGISIIVEIIWANTFTNFLRDLDIIQNSPAKVKIVIVNPDLLGQEKVVHHFDKARIADIAKGYMVSRLLDGKKILCDTRYLTSTVKDTVFELLSYVSLHPEDSLAHFIDLKKKVIIPAITALGIEPFTLPRINGPPAFGESIDAGLLNDLVNYHYPDVKGIWNLVARLSEKRVNLDTRINDSIGSLIRDRLDAVQLEHKVSIFGEHDIKNAIPIVEVTAGLRKLIEDGNFKSEIDKKLIVKPHHGSSSSILFMRDQHPEIYSIKGEGSERKAQMLREKLKLIFTEINSNREIRRYVSQYKNVETQLEKSRIKLLGMLNQLADKVNLNIVTKCPYLIPGLE
jgi:hypothetical protein